MTSDSTTNPPLPSPPFHIVPNINNLRDVALFPLTTPTGPIRPKILFRSAEVSHLDASGWQVLHSLGIRHVFDLRSKPEVDREGGATPHFLESMQAAGIERSWTPVFGQIDYSPEGIAKRYVKYMDEDVAGFVAAYHDILKSGGPAFGTIFRYIVKEEGKGVLVHCSAGKDRTGMFFAVLFSYLGVNNDTIAEEYHLTERGLRSVRDSVVERLMTSPAFKNYVASQASGRPLTNEEIAKLIEAGDDVEDKDISPEALAKGREAATRMVGAKKESMLGALEMLEREFGGAERYMREKCGLGDEELDVLRRNLIVKESEGQ